MQWADGVQKMLIFSKKCSLYSKKFLMPMNYLNCVLCFFRIRFIANDNQNQMDGIWFHIRFIR